LADSPITNLSGAVLRAGPDKHATLARVRAQSAVPKRSVLRERRNGCHYRHFTNFRGVPMISSRLSAAALVFAGVLGGCAGGMHMSHGAGTDHSHASQMDMQSMCNMHKQMMAGKTAGEQQALMEEHMESMTPEARQRMESMMAQCK
jgi:hypothetical protein